MSESFKGYGKLLKLGAPASAAIEVEFDFAIRLLGLGSGATSRGTVVPIGDGVPLDRGHYTLITRNGHRHQLMNLGDGWQLLAPPG